MEVSFLETGLWTRLVGASEGLRLFGEFRGTVTGLGLFERLFLTGLCLIVAGVSTRLRTFGTETSGGV